jgi:hypothetical protein
MYNFDTEDNYVINLETDSGLVSRVVALSYDPRCVPPWLCMRVVVAACHCGCVPLWLCVLLDAKHTTVGRRCTGAAHPLPSRRAVQCSAATSRSAVPLRVRSYPTVY